jgi:hypothetical protein
VEKYAPNFAEHGVSIDLLSLLSDAQLQEIGVETAPERARIIAIASKLKFAPSGGTLPEEHRRCALPVRVER